MLLTVFTAEYLRRVRTKAFVLTTLLAPLVIAGVIGGAASAVYFSVEAESARERRIAVLDESGQILPRLREQENETYKLAPAPAELEDAKQAVVNGDVDVLLVLPRELANAGGPTAVSAYVKDKQSLTAEQALRGFVLDVVRDVRLAQFELAPAVLATINERLSLATIGLSEAGDEEAGSTAGSVAVGLAIGVVMLMVMWTYGALVMQATMEEKTSRMAEILVSSVRPFDLLMGKVLSIGGVAVTQLVVWGAMLAAFAMLASIVLPADDLVELGVATSSSAGDATISLPSIRFDVLFVVVLMLPLGYVINASLFGALGAMYESPQEAQVAVTIAMAPMIVAILMVQTVGLAPNSPFVAFGSLFPFTAPVMLPTRMLVADVPAWQVALSVVLCAGSALAIVWLAGRIFRGTLLTYGKKFKFRDVWLVLIAD